jgi:hypothetical protein
MRMITAPLLGFCAATLLAGCMYPSNYYGNPYQQPMYGPPGTMQQQPGTLFIPPSDAPAYDPGAAPSTYDEPTDTWSNPSSGGGSGDSRFFGEDPQDNLVPDPRDAGSGGSNEPFDSDFNSGF